MNKKHVYPLALKATQFKILDLLINNEIIDFARIAGSIYGKTSDWEYLRPRIKTHVAYLRRVLELHGIAIETIRGSGYRLSALNKQRLRAKIDGEEAAA